MENFKCETHSLFSIMRNLEEIKASLDSSLADAEKIFTEISDKDLWSGETALVGRAFLDLVVKYHSLLAGTTGESRVGRAYKGCNAYQ